MNTIESVARDDRAETVKSQRVGTVAWLAGTTAVVALMTLSDHATIGMGLGVVGVSGMVTTVCYFILRDR